MTSSSVPPGQGSAATKRGVALGALLLAIAAGGALWWRAQPAAPTAAPAQTAAPAPAPEPSPHEAFVPAPQPVAPPAAATTIVLGDDASPVVAAAEAVWDGKQARGVQDAPYVLERAVQVLGGPEIVEAHRQFTLDISLEKPFISRGKLLFDDRKGVLLVLDAMPAQLLWTVKEGCKQLYGPRRVPMACDDEHVRVVSSMWRVSRYWAGHWKSVGAVSKAFGSGQGDNRVNELEFDGAPRVVGRFSVEMGGLLELDMYSDVGALFVDFQGVTGLSTHWRTAREWSLRFGECADQRDDARAVAPVVRAPSAACSEMLLVARRIVPGVDPSAFVAPRPEPAKLGIGTIRVEAERSSNGVLLAIPGLTSQNVYQFNDEWSSADDWHALVSEYVAVLGEQGGVTLARWLPTSELTSSEDMRNRLPYPARTGWITAKVEFASFEELASLADQLREGARALGHAPDGPVYVRPLLPTGPIGQSGFAGEMHVGYKASEPR